MDEVFEYRHAVDRRMERLLQSIDGSADGSPEVASVVELGINHEQQHQELMLTDIKHAFSCNPLFPAYRQSPACASPRNPEPGGWSSSDGGVVEIGHAGRTFAFDNERPRHKTFLQPFELRNRLATNREFLEFMSDGGYRRPELWLSLGWSTLREQHWAAPLYWIERDGSWQEFSLGGLRRLNLDEPVCHVSYFEADAFARWSGVSAAHGSRMGARSSATRPQWQRCGWRLRGKRALPPGSGRRRDRSCSNVRRGLAMDGQPLRRLSRLCAAPGYSGRIQRQVHVQSICSARRIVCFPRQPPTSDLPQFLSAGRAVAVHRSPLGCDVKK